MKTLIEAAQEYAESQGYEDYCCVYKKDLEKQAEVNFYEGAEYAQRWIPVEEEMPPIGEFVLAYNPKWVNEDFNPKGVRIGFQTPDGFVSAHYWSWQDDFVTISKLECECNPSFSKEIQESTEPTHWRPIEIE